MKVIIPLLILMSLLITEAVAQQLLPAPGPQGLQQHQRTSNIC